MSGLINKVKNAAGSYNDADTGKHGFSGVAADGQKAFKNYQTDKADGTVDWKNQATGIFKDVKQGTSGAGGAPGTQPPPAQ